jgi:prevent-host-death family protein
MNTKTIKSNIVGFKELRENADKYIDAVEKGRTFTIVRRSKPIFKMVPVDEYGDEGTWETIADFRDKNGKGIKMQDFSKMLKKSIHEQKRKTSK